MKRTGAPSTITFYGFVTIDTCAKTFKLVNLETLDGTKGEIVGKFKDAFLKNTLKAFTITTEKITRRKRKKAAK